jgi:hypothetical protein
MKKFKKKKVYLFDYFNEFYEKEKKLNGFWLLLLLSLFLINLV